MKFINKQTIELDRELSDLDSFAIDFVKILQQYSSYVIISGYVAILLGRARASEDIDILIPKCDFSLFTQLYHKLKKNGFYCLNAEKDDDIYEYLIEGLAIRFAKKDTIIPNIELKWAKNTIDDLSLKHTIDVKVKKEILCISHLELQIAFKEKVLQSPKDMDDAQHIREVAKEYLDRDLIEKYKEMLHGFY